MSELANVILGIVGVALSLVFSFYPPAQKWYDAQGDNKGPIMLGFVLIIAGGYFGLGCVASLAALLHIAVACTVAGAIEMLGAVGSIALGNQLTYLFTSKYAAAKRAAK